MTNDKAEKHHNTDVEAISDKQMTEADTKGAPRPPGTSPVRPWTADFLLPSIRFRQPGGRK
jgi:hypothetical protein